jgi:hypothetical protein
MLATITTAVSGLQADLLAVGGIGIGISAALFGLVKGWGFVRKLIK